MCGGARHGLVSRCKSELWVIFWGVRARSCVSFRGLEGLSLERGEEGLDCLQMYALNYNGERTHFEAYHCYR